jgi:hypothetical protein
VRANLLVFRFLLRRRVSITMQLQQCYGMPLRRRAATATATATASSCSMSHLQVRHRKFTVPPIEKISLLAMHTRVDDSLVSLLLPVAWGPRQ